MMVFTQARMRSATALMLIVFAGCGGKPQNGSMVGGAGGSAVGVAPSSSSGNAGRGALVGGSVGLIAAGQEEKRQAERISREAAAPRPKPLTPDEVVVLVRDGRSDEEIAKQIKRTNSVFHLSADEETSLRDKGVSSGLIRFMRETEQPK